MNAVTSVVIARILGPVVFGQYAIVQSTVNLFTAFAGFRLGSTSTKYLAEYRHSDPDRAGRILGLVLIATFASCGLLSLIMLVMSGWLGGSYLNTPELATPIAIGSAFLFLMMVSNVLQRALAGFEDFKAIAIVGTIRGLAGILICIPMAFLFRLNGAMIGLVVASGIAAALSYYMVRLAAKKDALKVCYDWTEVSKELGIISSFAVPAMLTGFLLVAASWQGRAILMQSSSGESELGVFSAADQFRLIILFLPGAIGSVLLPMLSKSHGEANQNEFEHGFAINVQLIYRIAVPAALLGVMISIPLAMVYGPGYENVSNVLPIVMLAVFIYSMNQAVRQAFTATGRIWVNCLMHAVWAACFIGCCYGLVTTNGAIGFAWVHVIADGALLVLQLSYVLTHLIHQNRLPILQRIAIGTALITSVVVVGLQFGAVAQAVVAMAMLVATSIPTISLAWKSKGQFKSLIQS